MDDINFVSSLVSQANAHDLEAEVVLSALQAMKENPNQSIQDAMATGFNEWIK